VSKKKGNDTAARKAAQGAKQDNGLRRVLWFPTGRKGRLVWMNRAGEVVG
jgi:hypothetical protein